MRRDLDWLGLGFDGVEAQGTAGAQHEEALDQLAAQGRLYACRCSRADLQAEAVRTADGGLRYPGTCRSRRLPAGGWRECDEPLRAALPPGRLAIADESGLCLDQDPAEEIGDPVVRRRDRAVAYQLAGVVDDARHGVTRVVRAT